MIEIQTTETGQTALVDGDLTIYGAEAAYQALAPLMDQQGTLAVDLGRVSEIDSAGVQLLLVLKREREQAGHETHLINHSDAVLDVFQLMNLAGHFNDPIIYPRNRADQEAR